jgi:hypothetical protein
MNIEEILNSRMASTSTTSTSNSNMVPTCQNTMFPNPYQYQPLIHVPTRTNTVTLGEMGASVDMMRAQLIELSKRMDTMETGFSKFEKMVTNDVFLLKSTLSEHATELLHMRDVIEDTHTHVKKTNELLEEQDFSIDRLADIVRQSGMKTVASNIDLGIIRRRLSRVEDFTSEFYEQFESFKDVKNIIKSLSDHIDECDQDISSFVMRNNINNLNLKFEGSNNTGNDNNYNNDNNDDNDNNDNNDNNYNNDDNDNNDNNDNINNINNDNGINECNQNILLTFIKNNQEQQSIQEEDDFEKLL